MTRIVPALLWLWIAVMFAAYLYQFREFIDPVLDVLGLT